MRARRLTIAKYHGAPLGSEEAHAEAFALRRQRLRSVLSGIYKEIIEGQGSVLEASIIPAQYLEAEMNQGHFRCSI